ncbi:hypothetical protein WN51_14650 [Melipona quadrifasciata]|uniref:Uncharacterized protein n=1 Tax=Melipona quadrifasciata TaxID=166423 RepID=A0A0M9A043_9HYME|nr:hypothetical protein WN51_14650 [Melipona quadrifasciata]
MYFNICKQRTEQRSFFNNFYPVIYLQEEDELLYTVWSLVMVREPITGAREVTLKFYHARDDLIVQRGLRLGMHDGRTNGLEISMRKICLIIEQKAPASAEPERDNERKTEGNDESFLFKQSYNARQCFCCRSGDNRARLNNVDGRSEGTLLRLRQARPCLCVSAGVWPQAGQLNHKSHYTSMFSLAGPFWTLRYISTCLAHLRISAFARQNDKEFSTRQNTSQVPGYKEQDSKVKRATLLCGAGSSVDSNEDKYTLADNVRAGRRKRERKRTAIGRLKRLNFMVDLCDMSISNGTPRVAKYNVSHVLWFYGGLYKIVPLMSSENYSIFPKFLSHKITKSQHETYHNSPSRTNLIPQRMFSLHPSRLIRQPAPDETRRVRPLEFTIPILPLYMLLRPEARKAPYNQDQQIFKVDQNSYREVAKIPEVELKCTSRGTRSKSIKLILGRDLCKYLAIGLDSFRALASNNERLERLVQFAEIVNFCLKLFKIEEFGRELKAYKTKARKIIPRFRFYRNSCSTFYLKTDCIDLDSFKVYNSKRIKEKRTTRKIAVGVIAQYQTTPLPLEVYSTPPRESRDPNQPIANFRCISVAPGLPPLKSLSVIIGSAENKQVSQSEYLQRTVYSQRTRSRHWRWAKETNNFLELSRVHHISLAMAFHPALRGRVQSKFSRPFGCDM